MGERGRVCAHRGARVLLSGFPIPAVAAKMSKQYFVEMAVCMPNPRAAQRCVYTSRGLGVLPQLSRFPSSRKSCASSTFTIWLFASLTPMRRALLSGFQIPAVAARMSKQYFVEMAVCMSNPRAAQRRVYTSRGLGVLPQLSRFPPSRKSCASRPFTIWLFASLTPMRRALPPSFPIPPSQRG